LDEYVYNRAKQSKISGLAAKVNSTAGRNSGAVTYFGGVMADGRSGYPSTIQPTALAAGILGCGKSTELDKPRD
jgi:hypothetical protein